VEGQPFVVGQLDCVDVAQQDASGLVEELPPRPPRRRPVTRETPLAAIRTADRGAPVAAWLERLPGRMSTW
jgi:hypothetical protein